MPCLQIAPMEVGRINIQYRRTECTPPEPLDVDINHNFGAGAWLRIVVSVRGHFQPPGSPSCISAGRQIAHLVPSCKQLYAPALGTTVRASHAPCNMDPNQAHHLESHSPVLSDNAQDWAKISALA